ncbi:hypothetical protein CHS0354_018275, partial [Potamilus streckersoni]
GFFCLVFMLLFECLCLWGGLCLFLYVWLNVCVYVYIFCLYVCFCLFFRGCLFVCFMITFMFPSSLCFLKFLFQLSSLYIRGTGKFYFNEKERRQFSQFSPSSTSSDRGTKGHNRKRKYCPTFSAKRRRRIEIIFTRKLQVFLRNKHSLYLYLPWSNLFYIKSAQSTILLHQRLRRQGTVS